MKTFISLICHLLRMVSWEDHKATLESLINDFAEINSQLENARKRLIETQQELSVEEKNKVAENIIEGNRIISLYTRELNENAYVDSGAENHINEFPEITKKYNQQQDKFFELKDYFWPILTPENKRMIDQFAGERLEQQV